MSTGIEINLGKWKGSADPVSLRAFGCLLGFHISQKEAVLLIEMVDGPWAKQDQIVAVIGKSRGELLGLKVQSILNRMIEEYEKLLITAGVDLYGKKFAVGMDAATAGWWENRKKELASGSAVTYLGGKLTR